MKQIRILATWLAAFTVALAMASNATAQSSKQRVGTVTKIKGAARVSTGNNIWRPEFWDRTGWFGDQNLPGIQLKWPVFAN